MILEKGAQIRALEEKENGLTFIFTGILLNEQFLQRTLVDKSMQPRQLEMI